MLPVSLTTAREVTLYYDDLYTSWTGPNGLYLPFVYPWAGLGAFATLAYLLIDHRRSVFLKCLRFPVFALLCAFQVWCMGYTRARTPAAAFGLGLLSAWGVLWVATVMVVRDGQAEFVRLNWGRESEAVGNGVVVDGSNAGDVKLQTGETMKAKPKLVWQQYPTAFRERIDWVADVFCNFRGVGWNFQISGVPPIPEDIDARPTTNGTYKTHHATTTTTTTTVSRIGIRRMSDRQNLLWTCITRLALGYITLDIIKTLMTHDPYFWGYTSTFPGPSYLPTAISHSPILLRAYRLAIGLAAMYTALSEIMTLGPLFFAFVLGPGLLGPRGEAWMNPPDFFGSYACVLDHGLAGWWGGWWHQTFRAAFEAWGAKVLEMLDVPEKSELGRTISLVVAFFLSGCLHAAGSWTQLGETRPFLGPMRFFLLQPLGILAQVYASRMLRDAGVLDRLPRWMRRMGNFVYVHVWGYMTAPLLIEDFAQGGVFLFEPVALSPLRGMGLGARDDGWWCWWQGPVFWRQGQRWWDSGIAA